jgi:pyruvate-ferredoxin/flavodoxin oxidoreductase
MSIGVEKMRDRVEAIMKEGLTCTSCSDEMKALYTQWIENKNNTAITREVSDKLLPLISNSNCEVCEK